MPRQSTLTTFGAAGATRTARSSRAGLSMVAKAGSGIKWPRPKSGQLWPRAKPLAR